MSEFNKGRYCYFNYGFLSIFNRFDMVRNTTKQPLKILFASSLINEACLKYFISMVIFLRSEGYRADEIVKFREIVRKVIDSLILAPLD